MKFGFDLGGFDPKATEAAAQGALADALNRTAAFGEALVVESTPFRTGVLRNSIHVVEATPAALEAAIATNVEYAEAVEFGTGIHSEAEGAPKRPIVIKARKAKALRFVVGGQVVFRRSVTLQGQKPAAMFRSNLPAIEERLGEEMEAALEGLGFR